MRIIIDMQGRQTPTSAHRGVGRYTEQIAKALLRQAGGAEIYLALNGAFPASFDEVKAEFRDLLPGERLVTWQQFYDTSATGGGHRLALKAAQATREHFLNSFDPDVIFAPNLQEGLVDSAITGVRAIRSRAVYASTLHDLVPLYSGDYLRDPTTRQWYFDKIRDVQASDLVVTVSDASRDEIVERLRLSPARLVVAKNGYDEKRFHRPAAQPDVDAMLARYGIGRDFLLYVGGADRHKNLERLLQAYALLDEALRSRVALVLSGDGAGVPALAVLARQLGVFDDVVFCGRVSDDDLPALYASCVGFVFPSLHEGFGLPVVEALACGAAVIGSDTPAIREIIGEASALFDPSDEVEIADRLRRVCVEPEFRQALMARSTVIAGRYSWDEAARTLLRAFESAVAGRSRPRFERDAYVADAIVELGSRFGALAGEPEGLVASSIAESLSPSARPKLLLDVSTIVSIDHKTGIQRVTRAIAGALLANPDLHGAVDLVYSTGDGKTFKLAHGYMWSAFEQLRPVEDEVVEFNVGDVLLFLDLHPGVAIAHRRQVQYLRNKGVTVYHVVYDILPIERPDTFWPELCAEFRLWAETVGRSDGALCISNAVAGQLADFLTRYGEVRRLPFRVGWFHLGADLEGSMPSHGLPADGKAVLEALRARPSVLMVGTVEPRKAHRQAVRAFESLWRSGVDANLVIVGKLGWGMQEFAADMKTQPELSRRLFWLQGISDEYLDAVYQASTVLLAASEGEGFGLPLIEGAKHGIDLIARDLPVFREVAGDHAWYFANSTDPEVLATAIRDWLRLKAAGGTPRSSGLRWLNWTQSADQVLDFIHGNRTEHIVFGDGNVCPGTAYDAQSGKLEWSGFSPSPGSSRVFAGETGRIHFMWCEETAAAQLHVRHQSSPQVLQTLGFAINGVDVKAVPRKHDGSLVTFDLPALRRGRNEFAIRRHAPGATSAGAATSPGDAIEVTSGPETPLPFKLLSLRFVTLPFLQWGVPLNHRSAVCLWEEFAAAEEHFRWTNGKHATIIFRSAAATDGAELHLHCSGLGVQRIQLAVDGVPVYTGTRTGEQGIVACRLPGLVEGFHRLELDLPDARRPDDLDLRLLALAVRGFELRPSSARTAHDRDSTPAGASRGA